MINKNGDVGKWATTERMAWASCVREVGDAAPTKDSGVDNSDACAAL